jgi:tetratricopeptide (TPR) repeat protein
MLANFSVEQSLMKAKSHLRNGEITEAQHLYETILKKFSNNIRAQQGLEAIQKVNQNTVTKCPPQEVVNQLVNLYNQGKMATVIEQTGAVIEQYPEEAILWNILGASKFQTRELEGAVGAYKKSISLNPNNADVYNNLGVALRDCGKFDEAVEAYRKSISLRPDYAEAYNNMGVALKDQNKLEEAIEAYNKSISLKPNYAEAYNNMGVALKDQNKLEEAIEAYNKSISLKPNYAEAYNNMGVALNKQGDLERAMDFYKKCISLQPVHAKGHFNMGNALRDQLKLDEAIEYYNKSILLKPNYYEAYKNMGNVLQDKCRFEDALEAYKKTLLFLPNDAGTYNNIGTTYQKMGKLEEAESNFRQAILIKPDFAETHPNLSFTLLSNSKIKEGLEEFEWRWKTSKFLPQLRYFSKPKWDGKTSLSGKRILIWCEQGIGDTLNFSTCVSFVSEKAEHCILECQEKLVPLLKRSFPNIEVKPEDRSKDIKRDDFDFHLPMGSLYKHFLEENTEIPKPEAYLVPDPIRVEYWKERLKSLGKGPYIGICWKSSVVSAYRLLHYPNILKWSPVLSIPDVTFINLQYEDFANDLVKVKNDLGVTINNFDDLDQFNNVDDVTALCAALNMAVTTKVTPMILSSGVGTKTKIANLRQSVWDNILFNPVSASVEMYYKNTWETWDNVFNLIAKDIYETKTQLEQIIK